MTAPQGNPPEDRDTLAGARAKEKGRAFSHLEPILLQKEQVSGERPEAAFAQQNAFGARGEGVFAGKASGESVNDGARREDQHDPNDNGGKPPPVEPPHHAHEAGTDDRKRRDSDPDRTGQSGLYSFEHGLNWREALSEGRGGAK